MAQPMGPGGVGIDLRTGKPKEKEPAEALANRKQLRFERAAQEAIDIYADLRKEPAGLRVLFKEFWGRLVELAGGDETCRALTRVIVAMRFKTEVAPLLAEKEARRVMGPRLMQIVDEDQA